MTKLVFHVTLDRLLGCRSHRHDYHMLGLLLLGGDARYLGVFWLIIVGLIPAGYAPSRRRQRQQTGRLRALAARRLSAASTVSRD